MAAAALGFGSRRGSLTSNRNTGSTSHRAGTAAASSLKQNQSITEADETPSSQSEQLLNRVSDDLTAKMRAWAHQIDTKYSDDIGDPPPASSLTVTVLAATGLEPWVGDPFWLAAVSGSVAETSTSTPLAEAIGSHPPAGTPSWSADPLTLTVHDVTSDLLLFLCESEGTEASRACVGRVILPLTELLPGAAALFCSGTPPTRRVWCDILPPAPCYAAGQVHTMYAPSLPQVYGSGMPKPTMAGGANGTRLSRPPSKALLELTLTLEGGLLGSYCSQPQFDSLLEHPGSTRHERPPLAPERLLLASHRVNAISLALTEGPACVRLARTTRPWSFGLPLLGMAYWLCFYVTLPLLPVWLATLYLLNAFAIYQLGHGCDLNELYESPNKQVSNSNAPSDAPAHATPITKPKFVQSDGSLPPSNERLRALEDALLPIVRNIEAWCSLIERIASAPFSGDPRATTLAMLPFIGLTFAATLACTLASAAVLIAGGVAHAAFYACLILFLLHLAAFHDVFSSLSGDTDEEHRHLAAAAATNPFAGPPPPRGRGHSGLDRQERGTSDGAEDEAAHFHSVWHQIFAKLPDEPCQISRAIARGALQSAEGDAKKGCCS